MYIWLERITRWQRAKVPHGSLACALCGRRIAPDEPCMSAVWAAQGGQYAQAYHPTCAYIVKLWGYPGEFLDPHKAEAWARSLSCDKCERRIQCARYVFDCQKAVEAIRLLGGVKRYGDEEEGGCVPTDQEYEGGEEPRKRAPRMPTGEGRHLKRNAEGIVDRNFEVYHKRREAGLCITCGQPTGDERCYCPACREKKAEYEKKRRAAKKEEKDG